MTNGSEEDRGNNFKGRRLCYALYSGDIHTVRDLDRRLYQSRESHSLFEPSVGIVEFQPLNPTPSLMRTR